MKDQSISWEEFAKAREICETIPFLTPASIQPHGMLIAFEPETLQIRQISSNSLQWFNKTPEQILQTSLTELLPDAALEAVRENLLDASPVHFQLQLAQPCYGFIYRTDGLLVLDIEPCYLPLKELTTLNQRVWQIIKQLQNNRSLNTLSDALTGALRELLDADRVVIQRFDSDGHGTVISEARVSDISSLLDQRFPATDVPQQVRRHALFNRAIHYPDIHAEAIPLTPAVNPLNRQPLNQAASRLRSMHLICAEFYRNMDLRMVLILSLVQDDKLWGYVCVHHREPKYLDQQLVSFCELISETFSHLIHTCELSDYQALYDKSQVRLDNLLASISQADPWFDGLLQQPEAVLEMMDASGFTIWVADNRHTIGSTPAPEQLSELVEWLNQRNETVFQTEKLSEHFPPAEAFKKHAAGLLALSVSEPGGNWLLWFRPEQAQTVVWAGKPTKPVKKTEDGQLMLSPRDSFERWAEISRGVSKPFLSIEIALAKEFSYLLLIRLLRVSHMLQLNTEQQLKEAHEHLNSLLSSLQEIIVWQVDAQNLQLRYISPPVETVTGYSPQAFLRQPTLWLDIVHSDDRQRISAIFNNPNDNHRFDIEYRIIDSNAKTVWLRSRGRVIHDEHQQSNYIEGISTDISERKDLEQQLYRQANYDSLTDLPNRSLSMDRLTQLWKRLQRFPERSFTLFYLDINHFKLINDSFGHKAGDKALVHFARQLESCIRNGDTVGRLGGDEFIVLLSEVSEEAKAVACVERMAKAIKKPLPVAGLNLNLESSFGVFIVNNRSLQPEEILHRADMAMYAAKKNQQLYRIFDDHLENDVYRGS